MKAGAGHPMGPLTLADFVGLDTLGAICDVLWDEFRERRFAQPPTLRKMLSAGWYGKKSGMGFYDYSGDAPVENPGVLSSAVDDPGTGQAGHPGAEGVREAGERALAGGPPHHREKAAEQGKLPVRERARAAARRRLVRRGGAARQLGPGRARRRRRRHRRRRASTGRPVAVMANDPTVKAGSWGPKTVEKIIRIQERALQPADPDGLPRRLGGRADHRSGADVPRTPRRRADLPQRGQALAASCRRSACSSARAPPAAPTSRPSATS